MEDLMIWAERPWSTQTDRPDQKRGRQPRDAQKKIDRCLSCKVPQEACTGQPNCMLWAAQQPGQEDRQQDPPPPPQADPCLTCWSRTICEACGGTCGAKERYRG